MVGARFEGSRSPRFEIQRAPDLGRALGLLGQMPFDVLLVDLEAVQPCDSEHLDKLSDAAAGAAIVVVSENDSKVVRDWVRAEVQEELPRQCLLTQCGGSGELLRRTLIHAWEHKRAEERLADLALRDPLTGLPNRSGLEGLLAGALARARRHRRRVAVLFIDLDRFKAINDHFGHAAGDRVLREVSARLRACLRESDVVARIGGDEFLAVIEELESPREAEIVVQKIRLEIGQPISIGAATVRCTASLGVAFGPNGRRTDPESLIAEADAAMYRTKTARAPRTAGGADMEA
jgi:diguanylate cyclase (GGDEF)-like protein